MTACAGAGAGGTAGSGAGLDGTDWMVAFRLTCCGGCAVTAGGVGDAGAEAGSGARAGSTGTGRCLLASTDSRGAAEAVFTCTETAAACVVAEA